jgi:hypothetical protein
VSDPTPGVGGGVARVALDAGRGAGRRPDREYAGDIDYEARVEPDPVVQLLEVIPLTAP